MVQIVKQGWISQKGTLREMHDEERDPTLYVSDEARRTWGSQNNRFPVFIHDMSLHDVEVGMWCVLWVKLGLKETSFFFCEILNSQWQVWMYAFLQHDTARDHTANNSTSFRGYSLFSKRWILISITIHNRNTTHLSQSYLSDCLQVWRLLGTAKVILQQNPHI